MTLPKSVMISHCAQVTNGTCRSCPTSVSGTSDFFDPSEFDTNGAENIWQVTQSGIPTEDGDTIKYEGCDDSYKVNEWNATGVSSDSTGIVQQFDSTHGFEFQTQRIYHRLVAQGVPASRFIRC